MRASSDHGRPPDLTSTIGSGDAQAIPEEYAAEYAHITRELEGVFLEMQAACPYLRDREQRGLPCHAPVGPDEADLFAARSAAVVTGVQTKAMGAAATKDNLVPFGLPPELHLALGEAVESPLDTPGHLADDLDFACRTMVSQGENFPQWQRQQWRKLVQLLGRVSSLRNLYKRARTDASRRTAPKVDPAVLDACGRAMLWPDVGLPWRVAVGFPIVGKAPEAGIYRPAGVEPQMSMDEFVATSASYIDALVHRPAPSDTVWEAVWAKSCEEQRDGILHEWHRRAHFDHKYGRGCKFKKKKLNIAKKKTK